MNNFSKQVPILVLAVFLLSNCNEDSKQPINQSYLNSETYRQFDQQSTKEQSFRSDEATALESILINLLTNPQTRTLGIPAKIDSSSLDKYVRASAGFELEQSMLNEPAKMNYTYYPVGKIQRNGLNLLFFMIRKRSVYDDIELAVATFRDTSIVEVQSLAEFKKNLSLRVKSTVQMDSPLNIESEIIRRPIYPIPQEYRTTYRYTITEGGEVKEEILSEDD